jgi:DNA-binding NarL/FixJ family response regulator
VRVVIADDVMLVRAGIATVLETSGVEVVAHATDADELLRAVEEHGPDIAIVDIRMPPTQTDEGLEAARRIRSIAPEVGVLVLSHHIEAAYAARILQDHPERTGYLLKDRVHDPAVLVDALQRIVEGETVIDPTIVTRLMRRRREPDPVAALSPRERDVLANLAEGLSNRAIAERLFVTERTVEAHVTHIFTKLDLVDTADSHRRVLAVLAFLRR